MNENQQHDEQPRTQQIVWRQGSILTIDAAQALDVLKNEAPGCIVMVASHDCDVTNANIAEEPQVEIVIGSPLAGCDANFTHAKSTSALHLTLLHQGEQTHFEFLARTKAPIPKNMLYRFSPDTDYEHLSSNRLVLQRWLAARYHRASFPDALIDALRPLTETFKETGKKSAGARAIHGIYIDFDPPTEINTAEQPYEVHVTVVYDSQEQAAKDYAEAAVTRIRNRSESVFHGDGTWKRIELVSCEALPDTAVTYFDLLRMRPFRLEYLSLRQSPTPPSPNP